MKSYRIGIIFIAICAFFIIFLNLMVFSIGVNEQEEVKLLKNNNLGSGMGMGGGLAAVGSNSFDVSHTPSKKNLFADETGGKSNTSSHHTHDQAVAKMNIDHSSAITRTVLDLPPAAKDDFDRVTDIVQCITSRGNLTIDVRRAWSPLGAEQFLKLIKLGQFDDLPFTRVCPRYITQFGRKYREPGSKSPIKALDVLKDDPSLWGKRDMDFGYVFFAGSGTDSRFDEMVVALCPMKGCRATGLGHAAWETPVATIRKEGFETLNKIMASGKPYPRLEMAGQHPRAGGPNAGKLVNDKEYLAKEYPYIEYWRGCSITKQGLSLSRPLHVDHPDSVQMPAPSLRGNAGSASGNGTPGTVEEHNRGRSDNAQAVVAAEDDKTIIKVKLRVSTQAEGEGDVILALHPAWAPIGVRRFVDLIRSGLYEQARFYRVIPHFMAQFGLPADPQIWKKEPREGTISMAELHKAIPDEVRHNPHRQSNVRGTISFAHAGANTRAFSLFINFADNHYLDKQNFAPIGTVIQGMDYVDALYDKYGEGGKGDGSDGRGPTQGRIGKEGNPYLDKYFPRLSYIVSAEVL